MVYSDYGESIWLNDSDASNYHDKIVANLESPYMAGCRPITTATNAYTLTTTTCYDTIVTCEPYHHDIVYIHKTNCPNCGGLLDGDEHNPYVKCACCGAKVWSEREVS